MLEKLTYEEVEQLNFLCTSLHPQNALAAQLLVTFYVLTCNGEEIFYMKMIHNNRTREHVTTSSVVVAF